MEVYVVTRGEYSDYSIHGVFSTRELAQEYLDKVKKSEDYYGTSDIEEYTLDEDADKVVRTVYRAWISIMTGEFKRTHEWTELALPGARCLIPDPTVIQDGSLGKFIYDTQMGTSYESMDHAKKIAIEQRQAALRLVKDYKLSLIYDKILLADVK